MLKFLYIHDVVIAFFFACNVTYFLSLSSVDTTSFLVHVYHYSIQRHDVTLLDVVSQKIQLMIDNKIYVYI